MARWGWVWMVLWWTLVMVLESLQEGTLNVYLVLILSCTHCQEMYINIFYLKLSHNLPQKLILWLRRWFMCLLILCPKPFENVEWRKHVWRKCGLVNVYWCILFPLVLCCELFSTVKQCCLNQFWGLYHEASWTNSGLQDWVQVQKTKPIQSGFTDTMVLLSAQLRPSSWLHA